jgi:hypothetical protein
MPIFSTDLKFLASERMKQQTDDGGGRVTATEVLDNQENGVFPDIASGDRIFGRTHLAKLFAAVRTPDADLYLASRVFLTLPPADPSVAVALFTTESWTDERAALANYVETYVAAGPVTEMKLLGNHIPGQKLIIAYQRLGAPLPEVGNVYVLSRETGATVFFQEYVRVIKLEVAEATYVDGILSGGGSATFTVNNLLMTISDPLVNAFDGGEPNRSSSYKPPTLIRTTNAAEASTFAGIHPLAVAAEAGDKDIFTTGIYTQIVPATQSEEAILDVQVGGETTVAVSGGARSVNFPIIAHTIGVEISVSNRQLNYTTLMIPKPAPGSVTLSYRAQGKWYSIRDDGAGNMTGSGAGIVNYATGSAAVTLLAIPDVGSSLLWAWGSPVHFTTPVLGEIALEVPAWHITLDHEDIVPGSVAITWVQGAALVTAYDDLLGNLVGAGTGRIRHTTGELWFRPTLLPEPSATPVVTYRFRAATTETFTPTKDGNGFVTLTTADPIQPGSVTARFVTVRDKTESETTTVEI